MLTALATPMAFEIGKGLIGLGFGVHKFFEDKNAPWGDRVSALVQSIFPLAGAVMRPFQGEDPLHSGIKAARQAIQKVLDDQASLVALFTKGAGKMCARLDNLQLQVSQGFNAVMQTIKDEAALRDARKFKKKLGAVTMAYDLIAQDIMDAAKAWNRALPRCTSKDIEKAETSATELYQWARLFVPDSPESAQAATRQAKLQTMPYIVAMAYATRVKVIVQFLERDMAATKREKAIYVDRARKIVDEFMDVLTVALDGLINNTSLLEIAMVYQLPIATYVTLRTGFWASVDELLAPGEEREEIAMWDDGLSLIRDVLHWKASDADHNQEQTIELNSIAEGLWWATFTGADLSTTDMSALRRSIPIRELCHVLGAGDDEQIAHFALKPGHESALLQLPPASDLRKALCANITRARHAPPPQTFARISKPPPPDQAMRIQAAAAPHTLFEITGFVYGVAVCPDGERVVSGSSDGRTRVWSLSAKEPLRTLSNHNILVLCVAVSPDGKRAVSGSHDKSVRVWSLDSGSHQHTLQGHTGYVWAVAVSPDGRSIASGSSDKTVRLWDVDTGQCHATLTGHSHWVYCVAFSPDGATLVSSSADKSIKVWNVRTRALQRTLQGHSGAVLGVAVTPDGRRVVSGSEDNTVKVWRLSSGAEEMTFTEHIAGVTCVAVFPDGHRIASGSRDMSVRVWNLRSRKLALTLTGHRDRVLSVAVSPDGRNVVSGGWDKIIKVWALSG